jgi:hypothetical protein
MKALVLIGSLTISFLPAIGQKELAANYRAYVVRQDSNTVVFNMQVSKEKTGTYFYIINADEKIKVGPVSLTNDSVNFAMPVFESSFKAKRNADGSFQGL